MDKIIKVGLIGFGIGGRVFHAPLIVSVPGLKLVKIRASRPDQVNASKQLYPEAEIVSEAEEIFNDSEVNLVVISTPNTSHYSLALRALEWGKNVVVDKPFTINYGDADTLIAMAKKQNLLLSVYQSRRFDSDFRTVQKIIENNLLGQIAEIEIRYDRFRNFLRPGAWREDDFPGSGILYDLGSHLIDQVLTLFGLPESVTANLGIQRNGGKVEDNFEIILHYPNLKAIVKAGMLVREPLPHFILLGINGSFVKYGMDVQEEALIAGLNPTTKKDWGVEPDSLWGKINTEINNVHIIGKIESEKGNYAAFYQNIYKGILGKEDLLVTAEEGRNTIRIIELAKQSHFERKTIDFTFS